MGIRPVGRARELATLTRAATGAAAGAGAVLVISGEAGIGKTTMLAHLTGSATAAGIPVLAGRGDTVFAHWPEFLSALPLGLTGR
jgi:predicted ATP-dependent serine protease